ncbi:hypothetical protein C1C98_06655 [Pseudomonas ogarae]|uniref:Uncharacterized protein n=1 Tax=Pseudomonas ogarae (strain DSM 112162 / CECT 30235 / F113) TaxID=1114970 RepID=A0ABM6QW19_PSEO1|nr:hypothetical protein C1C98_06655 [Pseudomonas ogarae]
MDFGFAGPFASKPAPTGAVLDMNLCPLKIECVGASLLAIAVVQLYGFWICRPLREQARSHSGAVLDMNFVSAEDRMCGSEPARDGGGSVTWMLGLLTSSRAGSLPQEKRGPTRNQVGY